MKVNNRKGEPVKTAAAVEKQAAALAASSIALTHPKSN